MIKINTEREREMCYLIEPRVQKMTRPVVGCLDEVMIPAADKSVQLAGFIQKLMAPPAALQVSGRVRQASV